MKNMIPFTTGSDILKEKKVVLHLVFNPHNYGNIKVDLYDSMPREKTLTSHNVRINMKSVWNKDQNHYYYMFLPIIQK